MFRRPWLLAALPDDPAGPGGDSDPGGGAPPPPAPDADAPLGPAGEKALAEWKARARAAEKSLKGWQATGLTPEKAAELVAANSGDEVAAQVEKARREAAAEATAKANERVIRYAVQAAAKGVLADPEDAAAFLDLTAFEVDDTGTVDEKEIASALADLLKRKPHLAAATGEPRRFAGGADGGAGKEQAKSLTDQIAAATAAGNTREVIRLQNLRLAEIAGHR
jgi:hypothetical protein